MFYDIYCELCNNNGLTPSGAAAQIGFNRASVTVWKNTGKAPKQDLLLKIADYFGVTTDYLLTGEQKEKASIQEDERFPKDLNMRMIARAGKKMTPEQTENLLKYAKYMYPEAFEDVDT